MGIENKTNNLEENKNSDGAKIKGIKLFLIILIIVLIVIFSAVIYVKISEDNCINNDLYIPNSKPISPILPNTRVDKPIIYIYPKTETNVSVKLGNPQNITCSYPLYKDNGWKVNANTNGDLVDLETKRNLYALYYECKPITKFKIESEGFIVKGTEIIEFLEEKLSILGLNEREAEEFIIYWLPLLQQNKYNYIRFASNEEINANMSLNVEPNPDTIIRVLMTYKGLEEPIRVDEQELKTLNRNGFVVVEWGATEIK